MASSRARFYALIAGLEHSDSRLYDALRGLAEDVFDIIDELHPAESSTGGATGGVVPGTIVGLTATIYPNNIRLQWNPLPGIVTYEVRVRPDALTTWDTATSLLHTSTTSVDVNPLTLPALYGTHTFLVRASNSVGVESLSTSTTSITIVLILAPIVSPTVIDNNVLLYWTVPISQFAIGHYNLYRDGTLVGSVGGNFTNIFETIADTYVYGVTAVDIVGNEGTAGEVEVAVNQPPDFDLQDVYISDLSGTKVNTFLEGEYLLCNVNLTEDYEDHFVNNSFDSPQEQIDGGYPYVMEPSESTGSYEEVIDYGTIISNTIIAMTWSVLPIDGDITVVAKIAYSDDDITYSAFVTSSSVFAPTVRYAKVRFEFTGDDESLIYFYNLQVTLNVKREIDGGSLDCFAADGSGTAVLFNKSFKDIESLTVTALATTNLTAVYDFVDIPDPTGFSIYVFNTSGTRVDAFVSWKARGII